MGWKVSGGLLSDGKTFLDLCEGFNVRENTPIEVIKSVYTCDKRLRKIPLYERVEMEKVISDFVFSEHVICIFEQLEESILKEKHPNREYDPLCLMQYDQMPITISDVSYFGSIEQAIIEYKNIRNEALERWLEKYGEPFQYIDKLADI